MGKRAKKRPRPAASRNGPAASPPASADVLTPPHVAWFALLLPLSLVLVLYAKTFDFGFNYLDDDDLIVDQQPFLSRLASVATAFHRAYLHAGTSYYRPVLTALYVLDAQWSGTEPLGYRVTNVLLHILAVGLLYQLLIRLRFPVWVSCFAASVFAAHPALVEAVAWIPGRNDTLFTVLALGAWLLWLVDLERRSVWALAGHLVCLVAALFTKESAVVLPLIFATNVWALDSQRVIPLAKKWGPLWLGALAGYWVAHACVVPLRSDAVAQGVGSLPHQFPVLMSSLGKLCLPIHLSPLAISGDTPIWPGLLAVGIIAGVVWLLPPQRPRLLFLAAAVFSLPLLPSLLVAERLTLENRLYFPAVGLCVFVSTVVEPTRVWRSQVAMAMGTALLVAELTIAWRYVDCYRDRGAITEAAVLRSPSSALGHLKRAEYLQQDLRDLPRAEAEYRRAIQADSTELVVHNNLGVLLLSEAQLPEAETQLREELAINPSYAPAHYNLGLVLDQSRRPDQAASEWEQALQDDPNQTQAMGRLAMYYSQREQYDKSTYYIAQMKRHGIQLTRP